MLTGAKVCSAIDFVEPLLLDLMGQFDGNILLLNDRAVVSISREKCVTHCITRPVENKRRADDSRWDAT